MFFITLGATGVSYTFALSIVLIEPTPTAFATYSGAIDVRLLHIEAAISGFFAVAITLTADVSVTVLSSIHLRSDSVSISPDILNVKFSESITSSNCSRRSSPIAAITASSFNTSMYVFTSCLELLILF